MRIPRPRGVVVAITIIAMLAAVLTATTRPAAAATELTITGHGYGHGRGLSQYGSYGYATAYSWGYARILGHFYGGTTLSSQTHQAVSVRLMEWEGRPMVVSSAAAFSIGGVPMAAGTAGTVSTRADGRFTLSISPGCGKAPTRAVIITSSRAASSVPNAGSNYSKLLTLCGADKRSYRGSLSLVSSAGTHVVNSVLMEDYLRGVVPRESPASWGDAAGGKGMQALMAQSVAARSYAYSETRTSYAKTCDTTSCQVYGGAVLNGAVIEDARTDKAILQTSGKVLRSGSAIVRAEFSSSSGGYTAGGVWPAVADLGDTASPRHNWTLTVSMAKIGAALGIGTVSSVQVTSRNGYGADGGRVLRIRASGSSGTVEVSGTAFRSAAGLYSDWFSVVPVTPPRAKVYTADGFGAQVRPTFEFGIPGDKPFSCDFDGNKADSVGIYRAGTFYIKNVLSAGTPVSFGFGRPYDLPVCGDWNGDGKDTIGLYRPSTSTFYLRNSNTTGPSELTYRIGIAGDIPITGDFDGNGTDTVGIYRPSTAIFYLLNAHRDGAPRSAYAHGAVGMGDVPIAGDWNGDGRDTVGIWRAQRFYLSDVLGARSTHRFNYGRAGDIPLAGDWNRDGITTVGVGRGFRLS